MVAFLKGTFVNMNERAHIMDSSHESIPELKDQSADNFNQSENNQLKSNASLPPLQHTWVNVDVPMKPQLYSYCCTDYIRNQNKVLKERKSKKAQLYIILN